MIGLPNHDETTLIFFSRNPKDNAALMQLYFLSVFVGRKTRKKIHKDLVLWQKNKQKGYYALRKQFSMVQDNVKLKMPLLWWRTKTCGGFVVKHKISFIHQQKKFYYRKITFIRQQREFIIENAVMTHKDLLVFKMIFFNGKKLISDRLIHMKLDFLGAWNPLKNIDFSHKFERNVGYFFKFMAFSHYWCFNVKTWVLNSIRVQIGETAT